MAGYLVHVGTQSGVYTQTFDVGSSVTFTYSPLVPGRFYYFAVSAYNAENVTSPRSDEVSWKLNVGPSLAQPSNPTGAVGAFGSLQLAATDDGDPLTYAALGLPPGLSVNAATGLISGVATTEGVFNVTASVSDGEFSATRAFTWTIGPRVTLTNFTTSVASPQNAGTSIGLSAAATGGVAPYQYRFVATVGSTTTPLSNWSASSTFTWTASQAGNYVIGVWVRSAGSTSDTPEASMTRTFVIDPPPGTLVIDNFLGASGTLAAHAPDVNRTGTPWTITGATPAPTISGGFARVGSGSGHLQATVDSGVPDIVMHAMFTAGSGPRMGALAFRFTDANNHLVLLTYNNALQLHRKQNGTYTLVASNAIPSIAAGTTHRLEVRAVGSTVEGWWDGRRYIQVIETFQRTATRHGLDWNSAYDATATYDYFELTTPTPPTAPAAPTNAVPSSGTNGVSVATWLTWSAPGATTYEVRFGTSSPPATAATGLTSAMYAPAGLAASTTYYWQVVARNAAGSTTGPIWSFTTAAPQAPPTPPGVPTAANPASGATNVPVGTALTWAASGATSYDVRFGTANPPAQVSAGQASASYTPAGLAPSTVYFWQVVARNAGGTTPGPVWSFTTGTAPTGLLVHDTFTSAAAVALPTHVPDINVTGNAWTVTGATPVPTVSSGAARVGSGSGHLQATINSGAADVQMAVDTRIGSGPYLAALVFRYTDVNNHLLLIAYSNSLQFYRKQGGQYYLLASQPIPAVGPSTTHRLEVRTTGSILAGRWDGQLVVQTTSTFQQTATRHGLDWNSAYDPLTTYDNFELRTNGGSAPSPAPPSPPASPSPATGASGIDSTPTLGWTAAGATSYDIRLGTSNPPATAATGLTSASFAPQALAASTTYYWQVVARNASGSTTGPVWSFVTAGVPTPPAPPAAPSAPTPASGATGVPMPTTLTWAATGATSYDVLFGATNPPAPVSAAQMAGSYTPAAMAPSTTYYWQVVARNAGGTTAGPVWSFTTGAAPAGLLVSDTFTSAAAITLPTHVSDVNVTGAGWTVTGSTPVPTVTNGNARVGHGSGHLQATINSGASDITMAVDCRIGSGPYLAALAFRLADANNHLVLIAYSNTLQFYRKQNGAYTLIASQPIPVVSPGSTHRLELRAMGSTLQGWWDGRLAVQTTSTFLQTATRHGLDWNSAYDTATVYDNFELRAGAAASPPSAPATPTPANGATMVATTPVLSWTANGATSYDVRFGTSYPPADAAANLTSAGYRPGTLSAGVTYYWQVIARNAAGTTASPVWSFRTATGSTDTVVADTFTGSDGSSLGAHAPDLNAVGAAWAASGSSPAPFLSGNAVAVSRGTGHLQATVDSGISDVRITVDCRIGSATYLAAIPFRFVDANNHLLLVAYDNQLQLYRKSGGLYILLATEAIAPISPGGTHRLELRAVGSRLQGWWDNVLVVETSSTFQQTATRHGLGWNSVYDPSMTYDNFELRPQR